MAPQRQCGRDGDRAGGGQEPECLPGSDNLAKPYGVAQWGRVPAARLSRWRCHTATGVQLLRCALEALWGVLKRSPCWAQAVLGLGKRGQFDLHVCPPTVNQLVTQAIPPCLLSQHSCPSTTQQLIHPFLQPTHPQPQPYTYSHPPNKPTPQPTYTLIWHHKDMKYPELKGTHKGH